MKYCFCNVCKIILFFKTGFKLGELWRSDLQTGYVMLKADSLRNILTMDALLLVTGCKLLEAKLIFSSMNLFWHGLNENVRLEHK